MRFGAFLLSVLLAPSVQAIEPYSCRNGFFPAFAGEVRHAEVVASAGERVHFRDDAAGCPDAPSCQQKAYLVEGDTLLVGNQADGWACVWYFAEKREFVGWLPANNIDIEASHTPTADDWIGRWVPIAGGNSIVIARPSSGDALAVEGEAIWQGGLNSAGERVVHLGAFGGKGQPAGDLLKIAEGDDDYDCRVTLQYVAGNLVVTDNSHCGGMNVRFDDVYRKAP
ncbi:hypothetical protein M0M42_20520 [Pseudomonas knackmussii]|uniref:SH3 domain-containing protein n=1 Tax=Pseudomonas knackmussii TaxID=65741 RepID=A0ABY4KT12_9PSED|nr:hypothetical protein [Pseudomonas knackmussii]UPQ82733.1 hypothetical protein M0M42_20520 [Pseudomonas knackmussii]